MANRVYYGEYSLKHWIDMMLSRGIELPGYQRRYVWTDEQVKSLIQTFREDRFVPPVTIGRCVSNGGGVRNYIIDGQQRLTAILMARLGCVPDPSAWENNSEEYLAEAHNEDGEDDENEEVKCICFWQYEKLLECEWRTQLHAVEETLSKNGSKYKKLPVESVIDDEFLEKHYLGFSYIVPGVENISEYYSKTFKELNTRGTQLSKLESRKSLYFLEENYTKYFDPSFTSNAFIEIKGQKGLKVEKLDFVRYISLLANYKKINCVDNIARGWFRNLEKFYERFICDVVTNDVTDELFGNGVTSFRNFNRWDELNDGIKELGLFRRYDSIIDMDIAFFGLFYHFIFEGCRFKVAATSVLPDDIKVKCDEIKDGENGEKHRRSPGAAKYLRQRIKASIELYAQYVEVKPA